MGLFQYSRIIQGDVAIVRQRLSEHSGLARLSRACYRQTGKGRQYTWKELFDSARDVHGAIIGEGLRGVNTILTSHIIFVSSRESTYRYLFRCNLPGTQREYAEILKSKLNQKRRSPRNFSLPSSSLVTHWQGRLQLTESKPPSWSLSNHVVTQQELRNEG
jgi:hypothetical protein